MVMTVHVLDEDKVRLVPDVLLLHVGQDLKKFFLQSVTFNCTNSGKQLQINVLINFSLCVDCSTGGLKLTMILKRKMLREIMFTYFPSLLLSVISSIMPTLPTSEVTMVICLAVLIAQILLLNNVLLTVPQTGYLKMVDVWLIFGQLVSFSAFCIIYSRKSREEKPSKISKTKKVIYSLR